MQQVTEVSRGSTKAGTAARSKHKVVGPLRTQAAQSQVLDSLKQKAGAAATVNPGSAAPSSPANVQSFHDSRLVW